MMDWTIKSMGSFFISASESLHKKKKEKEKENAVQEHILDVSLTLAQLGKSLSEFPILMVSQAIV